MESGYYPPGTEFNPDAPWNQSDNPAIQVPVVVTYVISKNTEIETSDYDAIVWEDSYADEEGNLVRDGGVDYNFENCNFEEDYRKSKYTLPELKEEFEKLLTKEIETTSSKSLKTKYKTILDEINNWSIDEFEVLLNE